jgi:hypothetical protein
VLTPVPRNKRSMNDRGLRSTSPSGRAALALLFDQAGMFKDGTMREGTAQQHAQSLCSGAIAIEIGNDGSHCHLSPMLDRFGKVRKLFELPIEHAGAKSVRDTSGSSASKPSYRGGHPAQTQSKLVPSVVCFRQLEPYSDVLT